MRVGFPGGDDLTVLGVRKTALALWLERRHHTAAIPSLFLGVATVSFNTACQEIRVRKPCPGKRSFGFEMLDVGRLIRFNSQLTVAAEPVLFADKLGLEFVVFRGPGEVVPVRAAIPPLPTGERCGLTLLFLDMPHFNASPRVE